MKRLTTILAISILGMAAAFANAPSGQMEDRHTQRMEKRAAKMTEKLGLSESQQNQMKDIIKRHMEERKAMRDKHQADIKAILSPDQQAKFDQYREERRKKFKQRRQQQKAYSGEAGKS